MTINANIGRAIPLALAIALAGCGGAADTGAGSTPGVSMKLASLTSLGGITTGAVVDTTMVSATDLLDQGGLIPADPNAPASTPTRFDATTISADGTQIAFTVYVPQIAAGNSAPLILEGHGWGGKRTRDLDATAYDAVANTPLQTAKIALDSGVQGGKGTTRGRYVISFDQHGFGESGGFANVMDPVREGRDVSALIDSTSCST